MIFRSSSDTGSPGAAIARSITISRIGGRQHAGRFEKGNEAQALRAEVVLLGHRVDAHAATRTAASGAVPCDIGIAGAMLCAARFRPSSQASASLDLVGLEAVGAELAPQLLQLGARVAAPVVFVDENEHFKHAPNIAQNPADGSKPCNVVARWRHACRASAGARRAGTGRPASAPLRPAARVRAAAPAACRRDCRCARPARRG